MYALYISGEVFSCSSVNYSNEVHLGSLEAIHAYKLECILVASEPNIENMIESIHTEKYFRNLIISEQIWIVITISR